MKKSFLLSVFLAPIFIVAQTSFDFKGDHKAFGWTKSGGASVNSGITTEGYELNWDAFKTPKLKHDAANVDAKKTPILAITLKIKNSDVKTLRIAHVNANSTGEKVYIAEDMLYRSPVATTFYYDLSGEDWNNYTLDGDHDFIEIGFQTNEKSNLKQASIYGDLVIEKIEFLPKPSDEYFYIDVEESKKWNQASSEMSLSDAE